MGNCLKIIEGCKNVAGLNYNIMHVSQLFLHLIYRSAIPQKLILNKCVCNFIGP